MCITQGIIIHSKLLFYIARSFENPFSLDLIVMLSSLSDNILCPVDEGQTWRAYISLLSLFFLYLS